MGAKAEETRTYNNVPMQFFIEKCRAINSGGLNVTLKSENPEPNGTVWFRIHHGMTMLSYAEKITVTLKPAGAGTEVNVFSTCGLPTQVIDYGKNRQNVNAIFRYLETGIESAQRPQEQYRQAPPQQPQYQQPVPPQYQQQAPQQPQYQQQAPQQPAQPQYQQPAAPQQPQYQQPVPPTPQRQFSQATQQEIYRTPPQAAPQQPQYQQPAQPQYQQPAPQQQAPAQPQYQQPVAPQQAQSIVPPLHPAQPGQPAPAQNTVFCTQCGAKNPADARFCSECGSPIIRIQA